MRKVIRGGAIVDYKIFCFNGKPSIANIIGDRENGHYKETWVNLRFEKLLPESDGTLKDKFKKPVHWDFMLEIAEKLASDFPFVRVDLYNMEGKVYFGELTFTPANGMFPRDARIESVLGNLYNITPFLGDTNRNNKILKWNNG